MKRLDRVLQDWRIRKVAHWIPERANLLDVGCFDGRLLAAVHDRLASGVGVDPLADELPNDARGNDKIEIIAKGFLDADLAADRFDVITMLAVLEHVSADDMHAWANACRRCLRPGGRLIATVPSPRVDTILDLLIRWKILDGMEFGQHHGAQPADVVAALEHADFQLTHWKRFQLTLNNLLVFEYNGARGEPSGNVAPATDAEPA